MLLFKNAALKNPNGTLKPCQSHMIRDTFAVEFQLAGVPIDPVTLLLALKSWRSIMRPL
jgi:integrase/recombinase XerD